MDGRFPVRHVIQQLRRQYDIKGTGSLVASALSSAG
jgi:hypothetical protein